MFHNEEKTATRKALAERTGLRLDTVRYDEEALVGDYHGRELSLYNFNKGRGGIYFCVDVALSGDPGVELLVRSGLHGGLAGQVTDRTGREDKHNFVRNFLVEGEPAAAALRVVDTASIQKGLRTAFDHAGGVELRTRDGHLVFEQLDQGQHDADYLAGVIDLVDEAAGLIENAAR